MNRVEPLIEWAFSHPGRTAIISDEAEYTFADLARGILHAAARIKPYIEKYSRLGLYLDNTPNFIIYEYAAFYLGASVSPINRLLKEREVAAITNKLSIDAIVCDDQINVPDVPTIALSGEWDVPEVCLDGEYERMNSQDIVFVLQTSGTTGLPKGVELSYENVVNNYDPSYRWIGCSGEYTIVQALPLYNTYGLNQGINLLAMTGAPMRLFKKFSVSKIAEFLDSERPMFFPTVPTMVSRFKKRNVLVDAGHLKLGIGAAPVAQAIAEDAWSVFPQAKLFLGYGLTEATAIVALNHIGRRGEREDANLSSVGKVVPGVKVKIKDTDAESGFGEILVKGANIFKRYAGTDAQKPVHGGWLHTGDMGRLDDSGWLYVADRKRDLIIRGGQNIYPGEIERILFAHTSVLEAAVIGKPDDDFGEIPFAFVTSKGGAALEESSLLEFCRRRLADYKVPEHVAVVDELPKGPTGKISKIELKDQLSSLKSFD